MKSRILVMLSAMLLLVGCTRNEKGAVTIGVVGPLTGAGATTSEYWVNGLNYAIDHLNAKGDGKKYKLMIEDCQSDPAQAVACYKRLELQGAKYVFAVGGQFAMAVAPLTKGKNMLFFTTADYNEAVLDQTDCGFRVFPSSETFGDTAADFLHRNYGFTRYASFALNTVACLEATKAFVNGVERNGGQMAFQETYDMGDRDFNSLITKDADKEAEAVFMTGFGISPLAFANQLASNNKFDSIVLFGDLNLATKSFTEGIRNNKASVFYADVRFDEETEKEYMDKYQSHSNAIVTSSYIIPFLIDEARAATSPKDFKAQRDYMRNHTFSTKIGDVAIDAKGNCKMGFKVFQLQ